MTEQAGTSPTNQVPSEAGSSQSRSPERTWCPASAPINRKQGILRCYMSLWYKSRQGSAESVRSEPGPRDRNPHRHLQTTDRLPATVCFVWRREISFYNRSKQHQLYVRSSPAIFVKIISSLFNSGKNTRWHFYM